MLDIRVGEEIARETSDTEDCSDILRDNRAPGANARHFRCSSCPRLFHSKSALVRHVFSHMPDVPSTHHVCELCSEVFPDQYLLDSHVVHFHMRRNETDASPSQSDSGLPPSQKSHKMRRLKKRRASGICAERRHPCTICGKTFLQLENLRTHYHAHTGKKPHRCKACGRAFVLRKRLNLHWRMHVWDRHCSCRFCPERFAYARSLRQHSAVHSGPL